MSSKRAAPAPKPLTIAQEGARALNAWCKRAQRLTEEHRYAGIGTPIDRPDLTDEVWALLRNVANDNGDVSAAIDRAKEADAEEERAIEEEKRADEEHEHAYRLECALADVRLTIVRAREHLEHDRKGRALSTRGTDAAVEAAMSYLTEAIERADRPDTED